jgi:hypothetical protein
VRLPESTSGFAVVTFERVFDVTPKEDVLTLSELVRGLTTFDLKPALRKAIARETARIDTAWDQWTCGEEGTSKIWRGFERTRKQAAADGRDPDHAVRAQVEQLRKNARARAKTDLRLFSPAHYTPGARRGRSGVVHLSCLVLDYDGGTRVAQARRTWERWFHVIHSTWSHTEAYPKFRVCLPLAGPVEVAAWRPLWEWAARRTGGQVDPSMKQEAATYAVPATPSRQQPRVCVVHAGDLLDPVVEGLVSWFAEPPPPPPPPPGKGTHFRGGVDGHTYLSEWTDGDPAGPSPGGSRDSWVPEDDFDWDMGA